MQAKNRKFGVGIAAYLYVDPDSFNHGMGGGVDLTGCTATFEEGGAVILEGFGEEYDGRWHYDSGEEVRVRITRRRGEVMILCSLTLLEPT